ELFQDYLKQQIGYEIVSRRWVFLVLATFCVSLLAAALWLARRKQLERLRWFGPALAAVAAGVLLVMGNQSKTAVQDTFAFVQLVHVEIDSENVQATGLLAEYHADASADHLAAETGGLFHPEMAGASGSTRRLIRTDMNRWHWENLVIPSGVQLTRFQFSTRIQQRLKITSRFGPQGLTGRLDTGPFAEPSDLVIATDSHFQMSVDLQPDGTFSAGSDHVLAAGEFVSGSFLNDEQLRRQQVYRKLLPRDRVTPHFDRPTLLVWTKLLPMGLRFPAGVRHIGSALLTIPLRIKSTQPGERVRIPAPFLPYTSVKDPSDGSQSPTYSNRLRKWTERAGPTKTWLRFQLPQQVLPLRLDRAVLTVQINGPAGKLEIVAWADGKMVSLGTRQNPLGRVRFVIERPEALKVDDKGGLLLAVLVGEQETASKPVSGKTIRARWKIESIRLQVSGETAKR
ncbi:MAG: hypothetical protein IID45_13740, partial [Planctomycetes bacterium]|nr:hypothetical protein [Planctomycetota bacterium]